MRILVVEDDISLHKVLKIALEHQGYAVEATRNGAEGFELAKANTYDLIVLDLNLPRMEGTEITLKLRALGDHTPILMMTERIDIQDRVTGLDIGADDYLPKPFQFAELYARIRALLRRKDKPVVNKIKYGPLDLDADQRIATFAGKPLKLMPKEFSLLEYMVRHKERIISRQELLHHVWNAEADHTSNRLDVYIRHLRRKLNRPGKQHFIRTVRGLGYGILYQEWLDDDWVWPGSK